MVERSSFGARVRVLRKERGLSQAALGSMLSTDRQQSWVSGIERDEFRPSYEEARELAAALSVSVLWLMYEEERGDDSSSYRIVMPAQRVDT